MISVTDLRSGVVFEENGKYFLVLSYEHIKVARGSGTIKVKVQNLETGANIEKSFKRVGGFRTLMLSEKKSNTYTQTIWFMLWTRQHTSNLLWSAS